MTTLVLRDGVPAAHDRGRDVHREGRRGTARPAAGGVREGAARDLTAAAADAALDDLDSASIGTLHSFAQQILLAHPIEAGLPPLIDVLDEVGSSVAFEERWSELQQQLLDDDSIAEPLLLAMAVGVELKHLRSLARLFGNDWDLIGDRVLVDPPELVAMPDLTGLIAAAAQIGPSATDCLDDEDRLLPKVHQIRDLGLMLDAATDQETQLGDLAESPHPEGGADRAQGELARRRKAALRLHRGRRGRRLAGGAPTRCLPEASFALDRRCGYWSPPSYAGREGRLEFHDLLVLARNLLRREPSVRSALQDRYQRLLLDEFQDTDPIQIELAVRIAGGAAADAPDWRDIEIPDGRLFVVGDPKQSIYRFRRANIATYLTAQDLLGETVTLTTNFRTVPARPQLDQPRLHHPDQPQNQQPNPPTTP